MQSEDKEEKEQDSDVVSVDIDKEIADQDENSDK